MYPRRIKIRRLISLLFLPLVLWPMTMSAEPKTGLADLLSPSLPIDLYTCPEEETEAVQSIAYQVWCARSAVKFKEFQKRWASVLKTESTLEYRNSKHWESRKGRIRALKFWFGNQGGILLFSQKENLVRILLRDATKMCRDIDPGDRTAIRKEAGPLLPGFPLEKIQDKSPIWPESLPGTPYNVIVSINMVIDQEGIPRDLCIVNSEPEDVPRFQEAAVVAILDWRYEPVVHNGKNWIVIQNVIVKFTSPPRRKFVEAKANKVVERPQNNERW